MEKGKKMPRLIDADKVAEAIAWLDVYDYVIWHDVQKCVDKVPTVDAEPVRHGRWIYLYDGNYKCSECGSWWTCEETPIESGMLFCPNCGASMDEVKEDDYEEPEINPCRGCEDYDGKGGCLSHGGCGKGGEDETVHG